MNNNIWQKIKKYLSKDNNKCIIIDESGAVFLVTRLEDNESGLMDKSALDLGIDSDIEKINHDINEWKAKEIADSKLEEAITKEEEGEVKIEDLPF